VPTSVPKSFIKRIFYTQEQVCILIDKLLNYFSKYVLATIDNKAYHFKDILKQLDKTSFIKAIEKKMCTNEETIGNSAKERICHVVPRL